MNSQSKPEVRARAMGKHEYGVTRLRVLFDNAVLGTYDYVFNGTIVAECWVSEHCETAYAMELAFEPSLTAQLDEMRAATKKLEAMTRRMEAQRKDLGEAKTFAEFARRAIVAAGAKQVYVANRFNDACRIDHLSPLTPKQGAQIIYAIGELENAAVAMYAKKAA
ncbi:hypothetical protein [Burkholderia vietnamiensis]|uniref:hypothetical protein n=1 Tax=Burkholderia vietnamiensis TaxID=60552 RepID=UPI001592EA39|nr:hypothetical protein [Burkholderia vietnamiensis]